MKVLLILALLFCAIYGQEVVTATTGPNMVKVAEIFNFGRFLEIRAIAVIKNNKTDTLDAVQFVVSDLLEAALQFNYFTASGIPNMPSGNNMSPSTITGAFMSLGFRAFAVFEFVNNDGVPGFQETTGANADTITGTYDLSSPLLQWNPIVVTTAVVAGPNGNFNATTITASTVDNVFLMRFVYAGNPALVNGQTTITPNQVKVDFEIQWFNNPLNVPSLFSTGPSSNATHPNAQVGLLTVTAASTGAFSQVNGTNTVSLMFSVANFSSSFSYANGVTVYDSGIQTTGQVYVHVQDTTKNNLVDLTWTANWLTKIGFFSFSPIRPSKVVWDPVAGQDQSNSYSYPTVASSSSHLTPFIALVLLVLLFLQ